MKYTVAWAVDATVIDSDLGPSQSQVEIRFYDLFEPERDIKLVDFVQKHSSETLSKVFWKQTECFLLFCGKTVTIYFTTKL